MGAAVRKTPVIKYFKHLCIGSVAHECLTRGLGGEAILPIGIDRRWPGDRNRVAWLIFLGVGYSGKLPRK